MKAFITSLDGLVAVSIMFLMLVLMFSQDFHPTAPRGVYLKQLTLDALSVLEKSGRLGGMASGNSTAVRELLDAAPPSVCMQVILEDTAGSVLSVAQRPECYETDSERQSAATVLAHGGRLYLARLESWYREVPS
ncbi:hypothetical protein L0Y65_03115 [Candidatus Micrarchaeota archaeon]|nr:hypothetical protein [Candidatus Micrarchaeota archaeon]